ncbi:tetratricopeptide repeat protein [Pararobbsia silviterrae]|uniref:Uncharacterized protein n=1 Tax=Pararobbsia silviterrae TaxID=1792498 RepID=A0A494X3R5_9BURK|nr:tetratricopeptide repeat protein [Pararobbsia silviterrae]RKP45335.1 hypothetical protein D7S86_26170 [Pararobbsia silviterrae]
MNQYELARAALEKKDLGAAERGLLAVLKATPDHVEAMRELAVLRFMQRRFDEAERMALAAIALRPGDADSHLQLADIYTALKRHDDAIARHEAACDADASSVRAWVMLGNAYEKHGRGADAVFDRMARVLRAQPDLKALWLLLGNMRANRAQHGQAFDAYDRAVQCDPADLDAQLLRAGALYLLERYDAALAGYDVALKLRPALHYAWSQKGNIFVRLGRRQDALVAYKQALEIEPGSYDALVGMGATLWELDQFDAALTFLQAALHVNPRGAAAFNNIGQVMASLKDDANAIAMFDRVHEMEPDSLAEADLSAATCRLRMGDFASGWQAYERRFRLDRNPIVEPGRYAGARRWNGERIDGKTLLVVAEQGAGDTFQFARYLPGVVQASGARVIFAVQAPTLPLLSGMAAHWGPDGRLSIVSADSTLPSADYFVPLMSLPLVFGTRLDSIPSAARYLNVPEGYRGKWRAALPADGRLKCGLVTSGNPKHTNDRNRSMPLATLAPLLADTSVVWCVVQPGVTAADAEFLKTVPHVFSAGANLKDFADTAALIDALDVVITVDTSVAHIAGALGKPVFVMLPWAAEWRWMHDRLDSPWYPSARLFRQPAIGDWRGVVNAIRAALVAHARELAMASVAKSFDAFSRIELNAV